ncbi:MAG: hypothetical protein OXC41_06620 [Gammaproteobacteria bacterium]|nr:hypothetical protein [Gammaproteobacteria bacterium]
MKFRLAVLITALFLSPLAFADEPQERPNPFETVTLEQSQTEVVQNAVHKALLLWCEFLGYTSQGTTNMMNDEGYSIEDIEASAKVMDLIYKHCSWLLVVE